MTSPISSYNCPNCGNKNILQNCEHTINPLTGHNTDTCKECETDPNSVMLGSDCFFCICQGWKKDHIEFKPRELLYTALEATELGKSRKSKNLPPPTLSKDVVWYIEILYKLFMTGYDR